MTGGRKSDLQEKHRIRGRNMTRSGRLLFTAESRRTRGAFAAGTGRLLSVLFACLLTWLIAVDCLLIYTGVFQLTGDRTDHILFLLAVSLALTLSMYAPLGRWLYLIQSLLLLLPMLFLWNRILGGFRLAANEVIGFINRYYGTAVPGIQVQGVPAWNNESHVFFLYLLTLLLWFVAYGLVRRRKPLLPLLPPVLLAALCLSVGKAPKPEALVLFFLLAAGTLGYTGGTVTENAAERGRGTSGLRLRHTLLGVCLAGLMVTAVWGAAYPKAQEMVDRRADIEDYAADSVNYMIQTLSSVSGGFSWFGWQEEGRISNSTPEYSQTEVLRVAVDRLPQDTVYLRGYVGDTYDHGKWNNEGDAPFTEEVSGWAEYLREGSGSRVQSLPYIFGTASGDPDVMTYDISYTDPDRDYAYLPYYTDTAGVTDPDSGQAAELTFVGDSMTERGDQSRIRVQGNRQNGIFDQIYTSDELKYMQDGTLSQTDQVFMDCYSAYAERYTDVDEELTDLKTLGGSLRRAYTSRYEPYLDGTFGTKNSLSDGSFAAVRREQMRELIGVSMVQQELWKRSYDLELENVPFGEDVVEYFLFEGEKGYCEHFASAGVLLLREMGIPARYASGYVIWKSDFVQEEDGYTASVPDSRAHAWAEIYLEGVGWVPVEMTPGSYPGMAELTLEEEDGSLTIHSIRESGNGTVSDTALVTLTEDGAASPAEEPEEGDAQQTDVSGEGMEADPEDDAPENGAEGTEAGADGEKERNEAQGQQEGNGRLTDQGRMGILLTVLAIAAAGIAAAAGIYRRRASGAGYSAGSGSPGQQVHQLSGQIYRLMRRRGILKGKIHSDEEFRRQMTEQQVIGQEDTQRYLAIIEKAAYSRAEVTAEDAEFCRQLCRRLKHMKEASRSPVRHRLRRRSRR